MPDPATGILQQIWLKEQTTFDSILAYAATDAVAPILGTFTIEPFQNFEKTKEAVGTASLQDEVKTNRGGTWSGSFHVSPQAAGTPPDIGPALIKAAMGVETISGDTSVEYTLSDTVRTPLQGCLNIASNLQHIMSGAWVEEMTIEIVGNALPIFTFSGGFARFGWAYEDIIGAAGVATGVSECPLDDASRGNCWPGAVLKIGDDDNGGSGYTVTGYDWTSGSAHFDFSPVLAGAGESGGEPITTLVPSQTLGGTKLGATECNLTIDTVSLGFISAKFTVTLGHGPLDLEATSDRATGIVRNAMRDVNAELQFYFFDSNTGNAPFFGRTWEGAVRDVDLRVGADTTEERMKLSIPAGRLDIPTWEIGEDVVTATANLVARQSATAADEFSILFD